MAQWLKNLPEMQETWVWSLGWEDPLEEGMATHSSILAWRIPWMEEPGEDPIQYMGSQNRTQLSMHTGLLACFLSLEASLILTTICPCRGTSCLYMHVLMHSLFLSHNINMLDTWHLCSDFYLQLRKIFMVVKNKQNRILMELVGTIHVFSHFI